MNVEEFLAREYSSLRRFAAAVGHSGTAPDDLLHDALVAVLRNNRLDNLDDPGAYVRRSIVHLAANDRRRLGRRRHLLRRVGNNEVSVDTYPSDLAELDKLSGTARAVLLLHYVDRHPYDEVAAMLGMSTPNVRKIAQRARESLRHTVNEDTQGARHD